MNLKSRISPHLNMTGLSTMCKNVILRMLTRNPHERIGYSGLLQHPFFARLDWNNLSPVYVPSSTSDAKDDTKHFDQYYTDKRPGVSVAKSPTPAMLKDKPYQGFTYVARGVML